MVHAFTNDIVFLVESMTNLKSSWIPKRLSWKKMVRINTTKPIICGAVVGEKPIKE